MENQAQCQKGQIYPGHPVLTQVARGGVRSQISGISEDMKVISLNLLCKIFLFFLLINIAVFTEISDTI